MPDLTALALASRIPSTPASSSWSTVRAAVTGGLQYSAASYDGTRYYLSHGLSGGNTASVALTVLTPDGTAVAGTSGQNARYLGRGAFLNGKHYVVGGRSVGGQVFAFLDAYTPAGTDGTSGTWANLANVPLGIIQHDVVVLGGFLYSVAGTTTTASADASGLLYRYDPTANTWATLTGIGLARYAGSAVAAAGRIYYLGGYDVNGAAVTTASMYDVTAGTWTALSAMPATVAGPGAAFVVGTRAYVPTLADPSVLNVLDLTSLSWSQVRGVGTPVTAHLYGASFVAGNVVTAFSGSSTTQSMERLDLTASIDTTAPQWVTAPGVLPTGALSNPSTSTDGTNIFVSGGYRNTASVATANLQTITAAGVVTAGTSAPTARYGAAGAFLAGRHLSIGGQTDTPAVVATVEAYTPAGTNGASGSWATLASMPAAVTRAGAATVGGAVYVVGGSSTNGNPGSPVATLYRFDGTSWSTLAPMPAARQQGGVAALGTKIYYVGGLDSLGSNATTIYVYDTVAGSWSTSPVAAPTTMQFPAMYVVGGRIFLVIGDTTRAYSWDGVATSWTAVTAPLVQHGVGCAAASLGSVLFLAGGPVGGVIDTFDTAALSPAARRLRVLQQYLLAVGLPVASSAARRIPALTAAAWQQVSTLSATGGAGAQQRYGASTSSDGTNVYVTFGVAVSGGSVLNDGYSMTPAGTITALTASGISTRYYTSSGSFYAGRHCQIGGWQNNATAANTFDTYTPAGTAGAAGSWSTWAAYPQSRVWLSTAVLNGVLYGWGGAGTLNTTGGAADGYAYSSQTNTWTTRASLPVGLVRFGLAAVGGFLYALGGYAPGSTVTTIYRYDPTANTWTLLPATLTQSSGTQAVAVGGVIYVLNETNAIVETYTPATGVVGRGPSSIASHGTTTPLAVVGSAVTVVGGINSTAVERLDLTSQAAYPGAVSTAKALVAAGL